MRGTDGRERGMQGSYEGRSLAVEITVSSCMFTQHQSLAVDQSCGAHKQSGGSGPRYRFTVSQAATNVTSAQLGEIRATKASKTNDNSSMIRFSIRACSGQNDVLYLLHRASMEAAGKVATNKTFKLNFQRYPVVNVHCAGST